MEFIDHADKALKKKNYPAAIEAYRKEFTQNPSAAAKLKLANSLRNLGWNTWFEQKYEEARLYFQEAEEYYNQLKKTYERFKVKIAIGLCESALGNLDEAIRTFRFLFAWQSKAFREQLLKEAQPEELKKRFAKISLYLSISYSKKKNWKEAIRYTNIAYNRFVEPEDKLSCLQGLGIALSECRKYKDALKALIKARSLFEKQGNKYRAATVSENIAKCLNDCKKYKEAKKLIDNTIKAYAAMKEDRHSAYFIRAKINENLKDIKSAQKDYLKAIELIETKRGEIKLDVFRQTFFAQQLKVYENAVLSFISTDDIKTAYDLAQRAKSRNYNEKLETGFNDSILSRPEFIRLKKVSDKIDAIHSRVERSGQSGAKELFNLGYLERQYGRELQKLKEINPEGADLVVTDAVPLTEIQKALDTGTVVVDYYSTKDKLLIFCITKISEKVISVPIKPDDLAKIPENIKLWLFNIEQTVNPEQKKQKESGFNWYLKEVSAQLISPIEDCFKDIKRIIFIPHLSLHYLPFGLMRTKENKKLVEDYEIVNLPTVRLLKNKQTKRAWQSLNALIIADPIGDLKHANEEAKAIAKIITGPTVLAGIEAQKDIILKEFGKYSLIHFACHAKVNNTSPMLSELIVSTGKEGDKARITLSEIFLTRNNADLVVLSACETGIGDVTPGDEITCFPRAFIYSGASSVLVSLWEIDDSSTAILMQEFYKEWVINKQSKAKALQLAQLAMISRGYSPYHWAGFQLIRASI